jgi:cyclase
MVDPGAPQAQHAAKFREAMMESATRHLRIMHPHPGIMAFYDGRVAGHRFMPGPNWVDEGAIEVGIASYAVVSGDEALVYDPHVSLDHARAIRAALVAAGVRRLRVVLSHWHLDHVAGTAVFADCEVIANARTAALLTTHKAAIEAGTYGGLPVISPLILPTLIFSGRLALKVGSRAVELIEANIHSEDATVLWLADARILLAGDTVEDCVTYVTSPEDFDTHLRDLARLAALQPLHVLPNHGSPAIIAAGGYGAAIFNDTAAYIRWLQRLRDAPELQSVPMREVIAPALGAGRLEYFAPYDAVHRENIARVLAMFAQGAAAG